MWTAVAFIAGLCLGPPIRTYVKRSLGQAGRGAPLPDAQDGVRVGLLPPPWRREG